MKTRETARLLLFDADNRLLLMKVDDPTVSDPKRPSLKSPFWVTLGGQIEPGESIEMAARRELFEETGLSEPSIGPVVWYGEQELLWKGELTLLKETFIVVRSDDSQIVDEHRTAEERQAMLDVRWWHIDELEKSIETILPEALVTLIRPISVGNYPQEIARITL